MFRYICLKMFRYIFRKILINYFLYSYRHIYLHTLHVFPSNNQKVLHREMAFNAA